MKARLRSTGNGVDHRNAVARAIVECTAAIKAGRRSDAREIRSGVDAIDVLLPNVTSGDVGADRAPRAFLQAILSVSLEDRKTTRFVRERIKLAQRAGKTLGEGAELLEQLGNQELAVLVRGIAERFTRIPKHAAAMTFVPVLVFEEGAPRDWVIDLRARIHSPSAMNASVTGNLGNMQRAGAIRVLASMLDPRTPGLQSKLRDLLVAIGIKCTQPDVQQALRQGVKKKNTGRLRGTAVASLMARPEESRPDRRRT